MNLQLDCTLYPLGGIDKDKAVFDCGNDDINDFFAHDSRNYQQQLLGKTYCFMPDNDTQTVVAFFTLSNDSLKAYTLPNNRKRQVQKNIPREKMLKSYPATLIGRLGVNTHFRQSCGEGNASIGDQMLTFVKEWFCQDDNKGGCRFLVVDALNTEAVLRFYQRNNFLFVFSTEEQEREHYNIKDSALLRTRLMMFDLLTHKIT